MDTAKEIGKTVKELKDARSEAKKKVADAIATSKAKTQNQTEQSNPTP